MKKWVYLICVICLLSGCAEPVALETVSDVWDAPEVAAKRILLSLPADAGEEALCAQSGGALYICPEYVITVQTLAGGDLERTLRAVTGYGSEALTLMQTEQNGMDSIQTVWTAAGEGCDQIGRAQILSDGTYHYVLSVMADAPDAQELTDAWQALFASFAVSNTAP